MDPSSGVLAVAPELGGVVVIDATGGQVERLPGNDSVACDIVGRDFTADEWDRYVPGDEEVQSACPWASGS